MASRARSVGSATRVRFIVTSLELPCLRKTRLSVHAMAWPRKTNGAIQVS